MSLKAFIDESGDGQPPVLVLAGYLATAEQWADFADCWQHVLNASPRPAYFKMDEAMKLTGEFRWWREEARDEWLINFMRVIDDHTQTGVACALPYAEFAKVFQSHPAAPRDFKSRYFFAFYGLMTLLEKNKSLLGITDKIEFVFDQRDMDKPRIFEAWSSYSQYIGAESLPGAPTFADDREQLPLQAADMLAWIMRRRWIERSGAAMRTKFPWEGKTKRPHQLLRLEWNEQNLVAHIERSLQHSKSG